MTVGPEDFWSVARDLLEHGRTLNGLAGMGVLTPKRTPERAPVKEAEPTTARARMDPPERRLGAIASPNAIGDPISAAPAQTSSLASPAATESLDEIVHAMGDCRRCKLAAGRQTIVFGQGNPRARLMFVGEAPGADEDEQGLPFVGRAGQLLTDIIEKGLRLARQDVYIANVIKCRPPGNRNPEPDEILACQPFLERQIAAIRPEVIVALGKFAGQWLLRDRRAHLEDPRTTGRLPGHQGDADLPSRLPAPQSGCQARGLGGHEDASSRSSGPTP